MTELLERWARLEPERCGISEHAVHLGTPFAFRIHGAVLTADPINLAVILAAVIDAIEARGWFWNVGTTMQPPVQAYVQSPERAFLPVRADTPAAALLGAYLAALEAADADEPETARFTATLKAENETLRAAVLNIAKTLRDTNGETNQ